MDTVLIFTGSEAPQLDLSEELPKPDLVIAADSGYDYAVRLGFRVDVLVGDMDSISNTEVPDHVIIERHPTDKDASDLDLALELVLREAPERVVIVGGAGGRGDLRSSGNHLRRERRVTGEDASEDPVAVALRFEGPLHDDDSIKNEIPAKVQVAALIKSRSMI